MNAVQTFFHFFTIYQERHPYILSFFLATLFLIFILFYTQSVDIVSDQTQADRLEFIDIDQIKSSRRDVTRTFSTEKGDVQEKSPVDRAQGVSETDNTVDLAFAPNIAPPKPIGRLRKLYPDNARKQNIEATVFVSILIDQGGIVRKVTVIGTRINKELPSALMSAMKADFARTAKQILMGARFTPSIVNGNRVPIRMELPLSFRLDDL